MTVDVPCGSEQHRLVVVVLIEADLRDDLVDAPAIAAQVLCVALKGVGVVPIPCAKQRLRRQVHLVHLTLQIGIKVFSKQDSNTPGVAASL